MNSATALRVDPQIHPQWWPDWRGKACAIVASGPSAKHVNVSALRGRLPVIAIKKSVELCPWADVVYGCDAAWWIFRNGLPEFRGLKIAWCGDNDHPTPKFGDLHHVRLDTSQNAVFPFARRQYQMLFDECGLIGTGANSGYQALNLAVQFGSPRILLIGFDASDRGGAHWYGRNDWRNANNPDDDTFKCWRVAFNDAAVALKNKGIEVVNASPSSTLTCFKKQSIDATLASWGV